MLQIRIHRLQLIKLTSGKTKLEPRPCVALDSHRVPHIWSVTVCFLSQGSPTHCKNNKLIKKKQDYNDCTTQRKFPTNLSSANAM